MASIQKRLTKNGQTRYRVQIRKNDGYPHISKTFLNKKDAENWAIQEENDRLKKKYLPELYNQKYKFNDLVDLFLKTNVSYMKDTKDLLRHIRYWKESLGNYFLCDISSFLISKKKIELLKKQFNKKKISCSTVNRYLASLSSVFKFGVKECGFLKENPCLNVKRFQEPRERTRVLSVEEFNKIYDLCKQSENKFLLPIFLLAVTTGMRRGEILNLTWDHVNLSSGTIYIEMSKNGHPRTVSIYKELSKILQKLYYEKTKKTNLVFHSLKTFRILHFQKKWEKILKTAKIKNLKFHDLRHTFATYAAEAGASNLELATCMGHRTLQMLQRYTHINSKITYRLTNKVGNKFFD